MQFTAPLIPCGGQPEGSIPGEELVQAAAAREPAVDKAGLVQFTAALIPCEGLIQGGGQRERERQTETETETNREQNP